MGTFQLVVHRLLESKIAIRLAICRQPMCCPSVSMAFVKDPVDLCQVPVAKDNVLSEKKCSLAILSLSTSKLFKTLWTEAVGRCRCRKRDTTFVQSE